MNKKLEMVSSPNLGNLLNTGIDKKSPLLKEDDHETYKITFDDKDEGKLRGQISDLNKYKKELGWNITVSPVIDENNFKYFFVYSYGTPMSEIKTKLNNGAKMSKWEKKESFIDTMIKKVSENKKDSKKIVNKSIKESDLTLLQNDYMSKPIEELSNFSVNDKVFVVEGPNRGCTGIIKDVIGENILILMEDYKYYCYPFTTLRKFSGNRSFFPGDKIS